MNVHYIQRKKNEVPKRALAINAWDCEPRGSVESLEGFLWSEPYLWQWFLNGCVNSVWKWTFQIPVTSQYSSAWCLLAMGKGTSQTIASVSSFTWVRNMNYYYPERKVLSTVDVLSPKSCPPQGYMLWFSTQQKKKWRKHRYPREGTTLPCLRESHLGTQGRDLESEVLPIWYNLMQMSLAFCFGLQKKISLGFDFTETTLLFSWHLKLGSPAHESCLRFSFV